MSLRNEDRKRQKQLEKERKLEEKREKKRRGAKNKQYALISYAFVAIFVALIGYVIYFDGIKSEEFINSPYNTRQDTFADRVIRGSIVSADGETLAYSQVNDDGSETRVYPYSNVFAHAIGYASNGKSGLESEANFTLLTSHAFFLEQIINEFKGEKNTGDSVVTTLDTTLQQAAYSALGDRNGAVVVMEPDTGKLLAMVSKSDFDPNTISANWDSLVNDSANSSLLNRATQGQYPPGSTFKIVTALTYLREHGSLDGFDYNCQGTITVQDHTIHCYDYAVHGQENLTSAFANSCNCAFAQIGLDLGAGSLRQVGDSLLFNKKLPLTMDYKKSVLSVDKNSGDPLLMQTSIGQGDTLVSPMHMAMIVSAIANQGNLMTPYMVDHVENYNGDEISKNVPEAYRELMTSSEASQLTALMQEVVNSGTATSLANQGYSVAGKTGSAEYDSEGNSHSWFVGFSNVENPDIVVSIVVEEGGTGSEAAVPIAQSIFNEYYY